MMYTLSVANLIELPFLMTVLGQLKVILLLATPRAVI